MGLEDIVSKRLGSRDTSGRTRDWLKFKNPAAPAVKREASSCPMYLIQWGQMIIASSSIIPSPIASTATATGS